MPPIDPGPWVQAWQLIQDQAEELESLLQEEWRTSMNAIDRIREFDCHGDWWVYVKTAIPAAGDALWLLLTPSLDEILEEYLNPKNGRGGSRRGRRSRRFWNVGNRGQRRLFWRNLIPDVDEEIARRIPGGRLVRGRPVGPGEWLFWTGVDTLDRVLWYWLVWEASQTFLTEWQSEIFKSKECDSLDEGGFRATWVNRNLSGPRIMWLKEENLTVHHRDLMDHRLGREVISNVGAFDGDIVFQSKLVHEQAIDIDLVCDEATITATLYALDEDMLPHAVQQQSVTNSDIRQRDVVTYEFNMRHEAQGIYGWRIESEITDFAGFCNFTFLENRGRIGCNANFRDV